MQAAHTTRLVLAKKALQCQNTDENSAFDLCRTPKPHSCPNCDRQLSTEEDGAYDFAIAMVVAGEGSVNIREVVVYVGGYLLRRRDIHFEDFSSCPVEWQNYTQSVSRGGLIIPSCDLVSFISMCYVFFTCLSPSDICINFLKCQFSSFLELFPELKDLNDIHLRALANIFCNNFAKRSKETTTTSDKKSLLKFQ